MIGRGWGSKRNLYKSAFRGWATRRMFVPFRSLLWQHLHDQATGKFGTFARASSATYVDAETGLVTTVGSNVARYETVGGKRAILLEPVGTNSCLRSRNLGHATWSLNGTPSATQNAVGIDGVANTWYVACLKAGYSVGGTAKMRLGINSGSGIS